MNVLLHVSTTLVKTAAAGENAAGRANNLDQHMETSHAETKVYANVDSAVCEVTCATITVSVDAPSQLWGL